MTNICFLDMIEQPPIALLLRHMSDVRACIEQFKLFVGLVGDNNWLGAEDTFARLVELEKQADIKKSEFRMLLRKDLILQISKSDFLRVVLEQDKLANLSRDVCGLLLWRKQSFPEDMKDKIQLFVDAIIKTFYYALDSLEIMATTVDSGFSKDCQKLLDNKLHLLDDAESVTDDLQYEIRNLLMEHEKDFTAVQMICYYDIVNQMGRIADQAQSYGHLLFVCISE